MPTELASGHEGVHDDSNASPLTEREIRDRVQDLLAVVGPRASLLTGAASLWDFHGLLVPRLRINSVVPAKSVEDALADDWSVVGRDLGTLLPSPEENSNLTAERDELGRD